jgi:hypothetical protein
LHEDGFLYRHISKYGKRAILVARGRAQPDLGDDGVSMTFEYAQAGDITKANVLPEV